MPYMISYSDKPLPLETLPAWKITHFRGEPSRGPVYAYLRCYVHGGALAYSATVFDEAPPATARFGFAFTTLEKPQRYLFLVCAKQLETTLHLYEAAPPDDAPVQALPLPPSRHLGGSDEQGFYWSAEGEIPSELLQSVFGHVPQVGDVLPGNVFLYDEAEAAFGSACPVPEGRHVPTAEGFGALIVTPY
ncbi:MAG: hypothetical protein NC319_09940 [Butyricicoccus sp.]|nr:hypothetical protein [Butyricicoccus sp.]